MEWVVFAMSAMATATAMVIAIAVRVPPDTLRSSSPFDRREKRRFFMHVCGRVSCVVMCVRLSSGRFGSGFTSPSRCSSRLFHSCY
jgi:hypothetical protein